MKKELKEKLSLIYKILILIVCSIGLYLNFQISSFKEIILYFTIQSNLLCFIFYFIIVLLKMFKKLKKNNFYYICKGMVTMAITLTMVVYWTVLSIGTDSIEIYQNNALACNFVHLYTPILIIMDYIIFGEKGNLKKIYPIVWSTVLIAYMLFQFIYILFGGTFANGTTQPYFYMNVEVYGVFGVFINNLIIYICYLLCGMLIQKLDNLIVNRKKVK